MTLFSAAASVFQPLPNIPSDTLNLSGVRIGVHRDGPAPAFALRRIFQETDSVGGQWIRLNYYWSPSSGTKVDQAWFDSVAVISHEFSKDVLITVLGFSKYGSPRNPQLLNDYLGFLKSVVSQVPTIRYWQIENEVLSRFFWKDDLSDYTYLLRAAYPVIKQANPRASVVLAGIPLGIKPAVLITDPGQPFVSFIGGNAGAYDIVDIHLYDRISSIAPRLQAFHEILKNAQISVPLWATEIGGPDPRAPSRSPLPAAAQVPIRFSAVFANGVERAAWHQLDTRYGRSPVFGPMALIKGGQKQPAYFAFQDYARSVSGFTSVTVERSSGPIVYKYQMRGCTSWVSSTNAAIPPVQPLRVDSLPSGIRIATDCAHK